MLKLGPPTKENYNFSQHLLGIGGTMIVALYLMSRFGARDTTRVATRMRRKTNEVVYRRICQPRAKARGVSHATQHRCVGDKWIFSRNTSNHI